MARLVFTLEDGTEIETELDADVISIGRHPESTVVLPSPSVSAHHASVKHRGDSFFVQDHATTNGTKLNGVEVEEARLEDGDYGGHSLTMLQRIAAALEQRLELRFVPRKTATKGRVTESSARRRQPAQPRFGG